LVALPAARHPRGRGGRLAAAIVAFSLQGCHGCFPTFRIIKSWAACLESKTQEDE